MRTTRFIKEKISKFQDVRKKCLNQFKTDLLNFEYFKFETTVAEFAHGPCVAPAP